MMGEHAFYVWTAYGLFFLMIAWLVGWPWYRIWRFWQTKSQVALSALPLHEKKH